VKQKDRELAEQPIRVILARLGLRVGEADAWTQEFF
jgi:hypothetical protein